MTISRSDLAVLRNTFAALYGTEAAVRRVVADAGLNASRISLQGDAVTIWHEVLVEASLQGALESLMMVAASEYPRSTVVQSIMRVSSSAPPPVPATHFLERAEVRSIGSIAAVDLALRPGWNLFIGDNGSGKTSAIRAIALGLAGTDARAAVVAARLLRADAPIGSVRLTTDVGIVATELVRRRSGVACEAERETLTQQGRWLTLGFPAVRGLSSRAIVGPTAVTPPVPGAYDVLPLVEGVGDARLDDTRQWIVNTALRAEGNEGEEVRARHQRMLAKWFAVLRGLMPGLDFDFARVDRETWQVLIRTPDGTIPIEQLSQGMVSTLGWIGTLLRRLYEAYPQSESPERENALVLVDEIDAHLHPAWQRRVVPLVRSHFPNVQVVATSHSPLVVNNLDVSGADAVFVFRRDDKASVYVERMTESLFGYRADQVLTSDAFGLDTTRSEYAVGLRREYAQALASVEESPEARERATELAARIRRDIPSPLESPAERGAMDAATRAADVTVRAEVATSSPDEIVKLEALLRARRASSPP